MSGFLTNSGLAKLAVATPLTPMTVKYMAFDSGEGTPTPTMNALFNEVYRTEIPNPVKDPDQPKKLNIQWFCADYCGWLDGLWYWFIRFIKCVGRIPSVSRAGLKKQTRAAH